MQYKTLFFSDIHLGSYGAQAEAFLTFIKDHDFETIYIIGDFIDFWSLRRKGKHWIQCHNDVLQKLLRKHRKGSRIVYVPGNHDEFMAQFDGASFGGIEVKLSDIHEAADGRKYLIMHGHELDVVMKHAKWLMHLGSWAYDLSMRINPFVRRFSGLFGVKNFSLSRYAKYRVKSAVNFIGSFEVGIVAYAKNAGTDGVVCGHIHAPAIKMIDNVIYMNSGDWVESLSAIVEKDDGSMALMKDVGGIVSEFDTLSAKQCDQIVVQSSSCS